MERAKTILKNTFGYNTFRPLQHDIINSIINKTDTLVIMPTGGGKSLCYQIPAIIFDGLTVVLSPLISLMKDQVEQLKEAGVNATMLNSSLPQQIYSENYNDVKCGKAKILYLAPESLFKEEVLYLLGSVKIECIVVDEAHCISEWGHDFRPDYRQIAIVRKKFPSAVCTALTATATPRVQDDIIKNLNFIENHKKFVASFNRSNLYLQIIPKRDSYQQVIDFLKEHPKQSGIIYCFSRKQVDELHDFLSSIGYSTKPYHAGLADDERAKNQDLFVRDEISIIIATIAFGMGINKSNVRFVLHHDLPKNIESYYQEIGRSGRDGLRADCLLLYSYGDVSKINYFIDQKIDPVEQLSARAHLDAMVKYAESYSCRRFSLINYFGERYQVPNCGMCDNCIKDKKNLQDITIAAQKFLSTVKRTGEIFGVGYLTDVLTGVESDKIFSNGHQNLTVYGIGKEYTKKQWQMMTQQFIAKDLVYKDIQFGSIKFSNKAVNVLKHNEKVFGFVKEPELVKKQLKLNFDNYDELLFDILRKKRKDLADRHNVPPYVIFSDKSLQQMAIEYPVNLDEFKRIHGIGKRKLEQYAHEFIPLIARYCREHTIQRKRRSIRQLRKTSFKKLRYVEVSEQFNTGTSLDNLCSYYNIKLHTILSHLLRYIKDGYKIKNAELEKILRISKEKQQAILREMAAGDGFSLKPIFEKLNGEVDYDQLTILQIIYLQNLQTK